MLKVQEKTIEEMKIMLYQSVAKEYLKKDKIQKFEEWLAGGVNLSREEEDVIYMVSKYLKQERTADELIEKEQFMENPFGFYSSYLAISLRERESIITDDLVKYYQAQIKELESRNTIKDREIHSSSELNRYYLAQVNEMSDIIKSLQNQISELEKDKEYDKNRYEKVIRDMNEEFMREKLDNKKNNEQSYDLLFNELKIREQIQLLLLDRQRVLKDEIKALKQILMVPKLQYKYIENMKLNALKEQNQKIVKNEIGKIIKQNEIIKGDKHIRTERTLPAFKRRSLPSHRRAGSTIDKDKNIASTSNFGFAENALKLPKFIKDSSFNKISSGSITEKYKALKK